MIKEDSMSKETQIRQECCDIWNKLKDKTKMIDYLIESKQRIAELEEQLKNSIVPKFKVGDKVYAIIDTFAYTDVLPVEIRDTHLLYEVWDGQDTTKQHFTRIFATKEEAEAKLEELKRGEINE